MRGRLLGLLLVAPFLLGAACSSGEDASRWDGQVTFLGLSSALPRDSDGRRRAAEAELWIDGASVWRGEVEPRDVEPEVLHVGAPVLSPGPHEFRLRVEDREWIDTEDVPADADGEMHFHCSEWQMLARFWNEPIGYE